MSDIVEDLQNVYEKLYTFVKKTNQDDSLRALERLEDSAREVGKSWSGSWLGYQSLIYYRDFLPVPAGAHFSSEWGTYQNITRDTRGDWVEYQFDFVVGVIEEKAGTPDITLAKAIGEEGKELFDDSSNTISSIFETYLQKKKDSFIESLYEKVKSLKIPSESDIIDASRPKGSIISRDSLAMTQGLWAPPHISILARAFGIRTSIDYCNKLAKHTKTAVSHIERQEKKIRKLKRVGTNVFIGHGRSLLWKDLKDFIQDRLQLPWDEFNRVPVAGIANIARLSEMLDATAIAFLVMTAEDEQADGGMRARMNVVHEAGLFQGRLGFTRAIVLLEDGCEEYSNIHGLGQIRFPKGNIKAAFEEVRQVLEREGIVDLNQ
jgi:predicted nucleotide-binding protein